MKTKYFALTVALTGMSLTGLVSCGSDYDDSELNGRISNIENRVSTLETKVNSLNTDIQNLRVLINSTETGTLITGCTQTAVGYHITFSDGTSIDIFNGQNGSNGRDGQNGNDGRDGLDGQDGQTPIIGVALDNGVYYWTVTLGGETSFLLDEQGYKIAVQSAGGSGTGRDGRDGRDGQDGRDGRDGVTPQVSVDANGYWIVSYDNGNTFSYIFDVNGRPVSALGSSSGDGGTGTGIVVGVKEYGDYVEFTLYNGTVIDLMKFQDLSIEFYGSTHELTLSNGEYLLYYKITGLDDETQLETIDKGNITSKVIPLNNREGHIQITATDVITNETKVIVLLFNKVITVTNVFTIKGTDDNRFDDVVPDSIQPLIEPYIPIHRGTNPPIVEGSYTINPMTAVFCQDYPDGGGYAPGREVTPTDIRFYNQNIANNTLNYEEYEGNSHQEGLGAFISGDGDFFTVYFNTVGMSGDGIDYKTALVISGEKTDAGIRDLRYAFIMVYKGEDPNHRLMNVGIFRVFTDNDGLAENSSWNHVKGYKGVPAKQIKTPYSIDYCTAASE